MRPLSLCACSVSGIIDYSMRVGSPVDGGLSVLAACLVAAFSCALPALVVVAPVPCDPALVVMQWLHPGCFQTWNFDDVSFDCGFLALMACVLFCERTFSGVMTLSEAFACGYTFYKNGLHAAAATAAAYLFENPSVATVLHMSEWCWFCAGFWVGWCILLWNICQVHLEKDIPTFLARGRNKDAHPKGAKKFVHLLSSRL